MSILNYIRSLFGLSTTDKREPADGVTCKVVWDTPFPDNWKSTLAGCVYGASDNKPLKLLALIWRVTDQYGQHNVFIKSSTHSATMTRIGTEDVLPKVAKSIFGDPVMVIYLNYKIQKKLDKINSRLPEFISFINKVHKCH